MDWLPVFSTSTEGFPRELCLFSIMVNDIKPVSPQTLPIKYADDITASVPVTIGPNLTDSSHCEVENIKRWVDKNLMTLNMKKTFEMVVKGKTTMPLSRASGRNN